MPHFSFAGWALAGLLAAPGLAGPAPCPNVPLAPAHRPTPPPADTLNPLKIVFFGSSVPFGQGATAKYGYVARYALGQKTF